MTTRKYPKLSSKIFIMVGLILLLLAVASFIGGSVGSQITGGKPLNIFNIPKPHPVLPPEKLFPNLIITNTLIASWITILGLLGLFIAANRKMKLIPHGLQNLVEFIYETAENFAVGLAGKKWGRVFLPVCLTIFLFVLANSWISLIPGFESIKINAMPLFRNANTDINVPLMLALISGIAIEYWSFKAKGAKYVIKFFNFVPLRQGFSLLLNGKFKAGFGGIFNGIIAIFIGLLEIISEFVRIVSFTFRLFGNMTAGVILISAIIFIVPWVIPSVFYGLETLVGFVQALIFAGLTLGFASSAVMDTIE
jgi:F-type H+-transporting ATPase subunit a